MTRGRKEGRRGQRRGRGEERKRGERGENRLGGQWGKDQGEGREKETRQRDERARLCEEGCFQIPFLLLGVLSSLLLSRLCKEVPPSEGMLVIFSAACALEKVSVFR